jgi:biotin synthase-like enzyme
MLHQIMDIIAQAEKVYQQHFTAETHFERAIFFSWYCGIGDCTFCYMSAEKHAKTARRSTESILAEIILCKALGWKIGFVSGGHDAYTKVEFLELLKQISRVSDEKVWINVGPLSHAELLKYQPYIKGVVASIETINPTLHKKVCPSKPIGPFEQMLSDADSLGIDKAMTLIVGIGESLDDFLLLEAFIRKHGIMKIHIYSLNPHDGTAFGNALPPSNVYHAEWIARTRIAFPTIDIQAGIWLDRSNTVSLLLRAGANSISKFPALRHFGGKEARQVEEQVTRAGRVFQGTLTTMPKTVTIPETINNRAGVAHKIESYIDAMRRTQTRQTLTRT